MRTVIGIVGKHINDNKIRTDTLIRDEVKQAIFDNGAIAIGILSPNEEILYTGDNWNLTEDKMDKIKIIEQINLCDGIILQGGITSEVYESFIAKYCYENNIPCLGICAGQNNIVRALGGTTFEIPNPEKHDKPTANNMPNKFITVSIFISFLFFTACQIAPPIITANGPKYRINPITPKLQIKAGNSISITNSPV